MPTPHKCPLCGFLNTASNKNCAVCGGTLATIKSPPVATPPSKPFPPPLVPSSSKTHKISKTFSLWDYLGWKKIEGQVIHIEAPYMTRPDFSLLGFLAKMFLFLIGLVFFGTLMIGIVVGGMFLSFLLSIFLPRRGGKGPGFLSSVASQVVGFFLTSKLLGPKDDVPVRDVRLRDAARQEHLVRLKGDLISGSINVGDDILVEGFDRSGTLIFSRGWNKRIRAEIRVKRR